MSGAHPPLPNEVPGGLPELIIGPDGRVYAASAITTMVAVPNRALRHRCADRR